MGRVGSSLHGLAKNPRLFSTKATSHHNHHQQNHKFLEANSFLGTWEAPKDPKEAERKLAQLRRDYAKQVAELRKEYVHEMELLRLEKQRKDEARMQAIRAANEERKRLKAEIAKVRAQERMVAEEEFRKILVCIHCSLFLFLTRSFDSFSWMPIVSLDVFFSSFIDNQVYQCDVSYGMVDNMVIFLCFGTLNNRHNIDKTLTIFWSFQDILKSLSYMLFSLHWKLFWVIKLSRIFTCLAGKFQ